jgi:acyl-CoA thioesterase-2
MILTCLSRWLKLRSGLDWWPKSMIELKPMELNLPELMSVEATEAPDVFVGKPESYGRLGIYGGHFLGQALAAGFQTVEEPKVAQSLHCYFLNPGDPEADIIYRVTRLKEGRGADMRAISAEQNGRAAFHMIASYKLPEAGDEHQPEMPVVPTPAEVQAKLDAAGKQFQPPMMNKNRATLLLITDSFVPDDFKPGRDPRLQTWMKSNHEAPVSPRAAQCALAFLSDGTLMFSSVLPYGIPFATHRLTSLDHSVWFHRACDAGDWLLFDQNSSAAADGRGMNDGRIFDLSGKLIATVAQDSMLRRMS